MALLQLNFLEQQHKWEAQSDAKKAHLGAFREGQVLAIGASWYV